MISCESLNGSLDLLENKANALEKRIIGTDGEKLDGVSVDDLLVQSEANLNSAVTNYSSIKTLLNRRKEFEQYLDPTYLDSFLDAKTKTHIVLDSELELRECLHHLMKLNELLKYSNSEGLQSVPENTILISDLSKSVLEMKSQSSELRNGMQSLVTKYCTLMKYCTQILYRADFMVTNLEIEAERKKSQQCNE